MTERVYTKEVIDRICERIASGKTARKAVREEWPELGEDTQPKLQTRVTNFLQEVLYGRPESHKAYKQARRMQAHSNLDRANDELENAKDKDSAYATRVKSEILMRTAEAWSPQEFGRMAIPGGGMNIQIITPLGTPEMQQNLPQAGYTISLPAPKSQESEEE